MYLAIMHIINITKGIIYFYTDVLVFGAFAAFFADFT